MTEAHEGTIQWSRRDGRQDEAFVAMDKTLDMECAWGVRGKQSLRGAGPTRLREAGAALVTGKWPRKAGLILSDGEHQWELTVQADQWVVSAAALPEVTDAQSPRELTEARLELVRRLGETLDGLYSTFLTERAGGSWASRHTTLRQWIHDRYEPKSSSTTTPAADTTVAV